MIHQLAWRPQNTSVTNCNPHSNFCIYNSPASFISLLFLILGVILHHLLTEAARGAAGQGRHRSLSFLLSLFPSFPRSVLLSFFGWGVIKIYRDAKSGLFLSRARRSKEGVWVTEAGGWRETDKASSDKVRLHITAAGNKISSLYLWGTCPVEQYALARDVSSLRRDLKEFTNKNEQRHLDRFLFSFTSSYPNNEYVTCLAYSFTLYETAGWNSLST